MKLEFSSQIFEKFSNTKFQKKKSVRWKPNCSTRTDTRTRITKPIFPFQIFFESAYKWPHPSQYKGAGKSLARPEWKNIWQVAIFRPTRRSLLPRRPGWTDSLLKLFGVACKNYSLVAVACFLPGRAKVLSAPRYFLTLSEVLYRTQWCSNPWYSMRINL